MNRRRLATLKSLLILCSLLAPASGQTPATPPAAPQETTPPSATPTPQADEGDDVVRITANLVQFDAVVYDKDNRAVTDLRPEDFEVAVGGKRQAITHFSYVSTAATPAAARPAPEGRAAAPLGPPPPPVRLRPEQVRRTVALVVDDLGSSFESVAYVRQALRKFVDEQMQPGDLVAVLRTSAGVGALQQFTSDRRILHKAIDRVRWYPLGRGGVAAFAPLGADPMGGVNPAAAQVGSVGRGDAPPGRLSGADEFREDLFAVGTLGALNFIVRGMGELPGRKSVVMFSDGFEIYRGAEFRQSDRVLHSLRRLADLANRAAVAVYTVDARGLTFDGLTAADSTAGLTPEEVERQLNDRRQKYLNTRDGLRYLAEQTGGLFTHSSNDLTRGIRRALEDQQGYYLIGFRPDAEVFDAERGRARYNRFEVKLRRAGLRVRTRGGFYGFTDEEARPVRRTRGEQLLGAITSPFASGELALRLTSLFSSGAQKDSVLESVLHVDGSRMTLADDAEGWKKLVFDVVAITFGENGQIVDELNRTETIRVRGEALKYVVENGFVYRMRVPLKKPGAYQLRVAVRDTATERLGSASQFVDVPDLKKNRLALSSVFMISAPPEGPAAGGAVRDPLRELAVRRFRQGEQVDFTYHIYNAKVDKATGRPQLQTQTRLFRDGRLVFEGRPVQLDPAGQTEATRLKAGTRLALGRDLAPGEYVFQVVVTDALADRKHAVATQWVDFEIVK